MGFGATRQGASIAGGQWPEMQAEQLSPTLVIVPAWPQTMLAKAARPHSSLLLFSQMLCSHKKH